MKALLAGVVVLALGACAATAPPPPPAAIPQGATYRDQSAPIGATSRFDAAKFDGVWYARAGFDPNRPKLIYRMQLAQKNPIVRIGAPVCDASGVCGYTSQDLVATRRGTGRYDVVLPNGAVSDYYVLWVDEGFRTAVLGNKAGRFGWILDRSTTGGADRIRAAREILDFNGYDLSKLKVIQ